MNTSDTIKDLSELTLDEKKRAHELGILEFKNNRYSNAVWQKCSNATGNVWIGWFENPDAAKTLFDLRITPGREQLMDKKESEKTMEYEYMTANTPESWHTIVSAICRGDCEIKRSLVKPEGPRGFAVSVVWDQATHLENGRDYRWKKPAPPIDAERLEQECRLARERGKVVCVWETHNDHGVNTSCNRYFGDITCPLLLEYSFCPFCGKQIKVKT